MGAWWPASIWWWASLPYYIKSSENQWRKLKYIYCWNARNDETLPNFIFKKALKKGREKETMGKDQKRAGHKEVRESLSTETSTSHMKHIN